MKQAFLILALAFTNLTLFAQNEQYNTAMSNAVAQLDSAKTPADFQATANTFSRIAAAESTEWLPNYYAAFSNLMIGFAQFETDLTKAMHAFDQAEVHLKKAGEQAPQESEIVVLEAYLLIGRLMENPMALGASITPKFFGTIEKATALNPANPRAPFLRGTYVLNMPEFYGGGATNAKPYFEKATELFEQETDRGVLPHWGKKANAEYLDGILKNEK